MGYLLLGWLMLLLPGHPSPFPSSPPLVSEVRFEGDLIFPRETLNLLVQTQPNRRLLGLPGITPWLWIYHLGSRGCCFSDRIARALQALGEPPAYLDISIVEADVERLRLYYRQEGYRRARITYTVEPIKPGRVRVVFRIEAGPPTFIRFFRYAGLEVLTPSEYRMLLRGLSFPVAAVDSIRGLRLRGVRFSEPLLLEERRRVLDFLQDRGFALVSRDSIRALVYQAMPDSFDVTLQVRPGPRMRLGSVTIQVEGPEKTPERVDTLWRTPDDLVMVARLRGESRLKPNLFLRTLTFRPGMRYRRSALLESRRRLERIGLFSFTDIRPLPDTTSHHLPLQVQLHTRPRHRLRLEGFIMQRQTVLGLESDTQLGLGLGIHYTQYNLLGYGEILEWRTNGSVLGTGTPAELFRAHQLETGLSLTYPYLSWPFGPLESGLYETSTLLSLQFLTARREDLNLIIRGRANMLFRLGLRHSQIWQSYLDLMDLYISDPDTTRGFFQRFLLPVRDPVERARILEDYSRPQINTALRYTLSGITTNPFLRNRGYSYQFSAEVGGNLLYFMDRYVFSPGTVEGSLPGLPFMRRVGERNRLTYRQYFRLTMDVRRYLPLHRRSTLALKVFAGWAHPLGRSRRVPFDRRFYIGGVNSVRGWSLRSLGPGALKQTGLLALGGDIKLEGSVEYRHKLFSLFNADWLGTLFLDGGNIWFGPRNPGLPGEEGREGHFMLNRFYRQLALGGGTGLRLAWDYLILRFDLGWKLHDPVAGWRDPRRERPKFYFAIGHTF